MGTYNRFRVDVNTDNPDHLKSISDDLARNYPDLDFCFRRLSEESKWTPYTLVYSISKQFPKFIFSIYYIGDYGEGTEFVNNGEMLNEKNIWKKPAFPTLKEFYSALKTYKEFCAKQQKELEEQRSKKELEEKQNRVKQLENELKNLKAQLK